MSRNTPTQAGTRRTVSLAELRANRPQPAPDASPVRGIRIHRPGAKASTLRLKEDERYVLGRHDAADVVFDSPAVSRVHGMLRADAGRWLYEDTQSRNGTAILRAGESDAADVGHHAPVELAVGDVLEVGNPENRVEALAEPDVEEVALPSGTERSGAARDFTQRLELAARTRVPVFLLGPSGCGKTHSARGIHQRGQGSGQFVAINCARLPTDPTALHSELLGHVRGAFTGAEGSRTGKLQHANGGTLFLDEVESMPMLAQGFLLDVLESSGDFSPLGSREVNTRPPVFRLISASKVPLAQSGLRTDLCERLAEGHMWRVPTLDERRDDIPGLMALFAAEQATLLGVPVVLGDEAVAVATGSAWPGQIRQLRATVYALAQTALVTAAMKNERPRKLLIRRQDLETHLAERHAAFGESARSAATTLPPAPVVADEPVKTRADPRALTRAQLQKVLDQVNGNQSQAARVLGIARNTLSRRMREFGIAEA